MQTYCWHVSKILLAFFILFYLWALGIILLLPLHVYSRALLILSVCVYGLYTLLKHVVFRLNSAYVALGYTQLGWYVLRRDGRRLDIELIRAQCVVWPALVVVCFREPNHWRLSRSICLPYDSLSGEAFRELKVHLRFANTR